MPNLHRAGGIAFNGFSVENTNGFYLIDVQKPAKPKQIYSAQFIPNRSKTVYGSSGYTDILIAVTVGIRFSSLEDRENKINAIMAAWCFSESILQLKHNEFYYVGKILDEVDEAEDGKYTLLTFPFICKPFSFSAEKNIIVAPTTTVGYLGDHKTSPRLMFGGTGVHTISCNGDTFTVALAGQNITVDCDEAIVYYDDFSNAMTKFDGDFIVFKPGAENVITWSGPSGAQPIATYKDTNVVKRSYTNSSYVPSNPLYD